MQLSNAPAKLTLPFANSGAKTTIPVPSQVGITPGAASLTDGFPPLTRTLIAAGGVPPSGLDMNGILFELSAIARWAASGAGFTYDSVFAADANVGGYPKGARVLRTDGAGYWLNTADNNTTDPEAGGAGWVPDFTSGIATVAMASANVTLTPLQYGKPIVVITGTLTANLNLIFPNIAGKWSIINNTTGAYTITAKTAAGAGVPVGTTANVVGDGAAIYLAQAAVTQVAPGSLVLATGTTAPAGTIKANGALLSRTAYAALWAWAQASGNITATDAAWGSATTGGQYSPGDGSTTFRVPDLRAEFLRALDDGRGVDTGRTIGSNQVATAIVAQTNNNGAIAISNPDDTTTVSQSYTTATINTTTTVNVATVRPRNIALLACLTY